MTDLVMSMNVSAAGTKVKRAPLRVLTENVANASSTMVTPGGKPYRQNLVTFEKIFGGQLGVETIRAPDITRDTTEFG